MTVDHIIYINANFQKNKQRFL